MKPHAFQEAFWRSWELTAVPKRWILSWPTGAGKTLGALRPAADYERVYICASALAFDVWQTHIQEFMGFAPGVITTGRRKGLSKKKLAAIDAALQARVILCTPALWEQYYPGPSNKRALLICDEAHMFDDADTQRTRFLRKWAAECPAMDIMCLTATFVRKDVADVWSLSNILAPSVFPGPQPKNGGVPFSFLAKYCLRHPELGFFYGANPVTLIDLKEKLSNFTHFVSGKEALDIGIPSRIQLLKIEPGAAVTWAKEQIADSIAVLCHHVQQAKALHAAIGGVYFDGTVDPQKRTAMLTAARARYTAGERVTLVGTYGSVAEAISLAWVESTLVLEASQAPGQLMQLLGRFKRPEPAQRVPANVYIASTAVEYAKLQRTQTRLQTFEALQGEQLNSSAMLAAMRIREITSLTEEEVRRMFVVDEVQLLAHELDALGELDYDDF